MNGIEPLGLGTGRARLTRASWALLLRLSVVPLAVTALTVTGCRSRPPARVAVPSRIAIVSSEAPPTMDSATRARLAAEARQRNNEFAAQVATLEIAPESIVVRIDEPVEMFRVARAVARDSAGKIVEGFTPAWSLADLRVARFAQGRLFGVAPGSTTLHADILSFPTNATQPVRRRGGSLRLVVVPAPPLAHVAGPLVWTDAASVAHEFLEATRAEDWANAARFVDDSAFDRWFRQRVSISRSELPSAVPTLEEYAQAMSRLENPPPKAVIEWQYDELKRSYARSRTNDFSNEFEGVTSFRQLAALGRDEALRRYLLARDPRAHWRRMMLAAGCDSAVVRQAPPSLVPVYRVLGAIRTSESVAWVAYAPVSVSALTSTDVPPQLQKLSRRGDGTWRVDVISGAWNDQMIGTSGCPVPPRR